MVTPRSGLHLLTQFCVGLLLIASNAFCDGLAFDEPKPEVRQQCYWLSAGIGGGEVRGGLGTADGGLSTGASFSWCHGSNIVSVRVSELSELDLDFFGHSGKPDFVWDVGALYGQAIRSHRGTLSAAVGLALVNTRRDEVSSWHLGVPFEGQAFLTIGRAVGVGVYAFADLNAERSFGGLLFSLRFGVLR